jgi:hypothetical protein
MKDQTIKNRAWTDPGDVRQRVQKLWDQGRILAGLVAEESLFPLRIPLKGPSASEMAPHFSELRDWVARLRQNARHYRIVWRRVQHRLLGANDMPEEIWVDSLEAAVSLIGKEREVALFRALLDETRATRPELLDWLGKRPLKALELLRDWPGLMGILDWMALHPNPGLYLRQMDVRGVHSKFVEAHRLTLSELLELSLPVPPVDAGARGAGGFCRRYGFLEKPLRIRFRILDTSSAVFSCMETLGEDPDLDITLTAKDFSQLRLGVKRVFITENEINFLSFPSVKDSLVLFGAGYGFAALETASWLQHTDLYYWGDLDTHGFAILDQLRAHFPHAASFLMDRETFLTHEVFWGTEAAPEKRPLLRLLPEEAALYGDLSQDRMGKALRLEQERISFSWVKMALERLFPEKQ